MHSSQLKEELRKLAELMNQQHQTILSYEGLVPKIEIDILMQNYRRAYELLSELRKSEPAPEIAPDKNLSFPDPDLLASVEVAPGVVETPVNPEPVINNEVTVLQDEPAPQILSVIQPEADKAELQTPVIVEKTDIVTEPVLTPAELKPELIIAAEETPVIPEKREIVEETVLPQPSLQKERSREFAKSSTKPVTASLFDEAPTVAQQFRETATVRDRFTATGDDNSIAEKLQQHPLSDLKKSIGINEKFSFINELFDGDLGNYNAAIDQLNNCGDLTDALELLSAKLAQQYQWPQEALSFLQLKNLVTRRFSA